MRRSSTSVVVGGSIVTALLLLGALATSASGQAVEASIVGRVIDESNAVLPGVTVTATSPALQVPQVTGVTDNDGAYRLAALPIGTYTLTYEIAGFQTLRREGVRLSAGQTSRIDAQMNIGRVQETVTVSGISPVVDTRSTAATTVLTRETMDLVPTARTGYNAVLAQAPGIRETLQNMAPSGAVVFRAFGQSGQSYQAVDGVVTANPKSDTQSGAYIDFSTLEESVISTLGHDASIPNRGVMLNVIVKSGGNDFHGTSFTSWTNHRLQSSNVDAQLAAQGITEGNTLAIRDDYSADLGGRIVRDKLWFYVSGRSQRQKENTIGCFINAGGDPCYEWQRGYYFTHKETWQLNASNRISNLLMGNIRRDIEGATRLVAWERRTEQRGWNPVWKTEWQTVQGNALTMALMYGGWMNHSGRYGEDFGSGKVPSQDTFTGLQWGTAPNMNERNLEHRQNVRWNLAYYKPDWVGGNHEFKVGLDYFQAQANRARIPRQAPYYELVFNNGAADQIQINNTPVYPDAPMNYVGAYVHDTWAVGRKLTLSVGARYAYDNGKVAEACREPAFAPGNVANPAECFPEIQFPVFTSLAPRLRFAYDLSGTGRTLLKAGWGRYMKMRYADELHTANRNVITTTIYRWRDLNGNKDYDAGEVNLAVNNNPDFISRTFSGQTGALANGKVNPDEKQPFTDEYMLQLEHELMANFGVRLTGIHSRARNQYRYENSLRPYETYSIPVTNPDPGPDGRVGTADDPGTTITYWEYPSTLSGAAFQEPWIVNDPRANKQYSSIEVAGTKRLSNRWQMLASYSATRIHDPLVQNVGGGLNFGANSKDPNAEIFTANRNWEWQGRLSGSYTAWKDIMVSANFQSRSGDTYARTNVFRGGRTIPTITLRVEPIGSHRLPEINLLDFRFEKRFRLAEGKIISLRSNLFNLFNANTITGITAASGPNFGRATTILRPRVIDFAAQYTF